MLGEIKMHDVIALLQDVGTKHLESGRALLLRRGQIGTVVMSYPDSAYEVVISPCKGHHQPCEGHISLARVRHELLT